MRDRRKPKDQLQKRGPKPIEIDWNEFDKLCQIQATLKEIAGWFDCSEDTIENKVKQTHGVKFSEYWDKKAAGGKISLRRLQWQAAQKGNTALMIWMGKQYLGQTDKQETELSGELGIKVVVEDYLK